MPRNDEQRSVTGPSLSFARRSRWFSKFSRDEISLTLIPPAGRPFDLSRATLVCVSLLASVAPSLAQASEFPVTVPDVRGRPRETFALEIPDALRDEKLRREELLAVDGSIVLAEENQEESESGFRLEMLSQFQSFQGTSHILHAVNRETSGFPHDVQRRLTLNNLGYLFPVEIRACRLGIESYRSRFRGSMFGVAAGIEQRLYVTLSPTQASIFFAEAFREQGVPLALVDSQLALGRAFEELLKLLEYPGLFSRLKVLDEQSLKSFEVTEAPTPS